MMKKNFLNKMTAMMMMATAMTAFTACSDDDDNSNSSTGDNGNTPVETKAERIVLATSVIDGEKTANVLLTSTSPAEGSVSPVNNGLVNDGATEWVFYGNKYLYALTYNQGNAGTTRSYILGSDG